MVKKQKIHFAILKSPTTQHLQLQGFDLTEISPRTIECDIRTLTSDLPATYSLAHVVAQIRVMGPVLQRSLGKSHTLERDIRELGLLTLKICRVLHKNEVTHAIFETLASHHIPTVCFEIACDLLGIKKVFFSHSTFSPRVIPMIQIGPYSSREILGICPSFTPIDCFNLNIFSDSYKEMLSVGKSSDEKYLRSLAAIFFARLTSNTKKYLLKKKKFVELELGEELLEKSKHSLWMDLELIRIQKKSLDYLISIEESDVIKLVSKLESDLQVFILYAHYQPEATSFPLGGFFSDHIEIVMRLRNQFPDAIIFYREHPHISLFRFGHNPTRIGGWRSVQYYKRLEELGCIFISRSIESQKMQDLVLKSMAITMSGTIGLERGIQGLKTIVTGNPWFREMDSITSFEEFLDAGSVSDSRISEQSQNVEWIKEVLMNYSLAAPYWANAGLDSQLNYYHELVELMKKIAESEG
jgi:hypothetical protein